MVFDESGADESGFGESGFDEKWFLMKVVFDEIFFDELDHFHPNFDESVPNHISASVSSRGMHATSTQCIVKDIPPVLEGIIPAVCKFLQSCSNV